MPCGAIKTQEHPSVRVLAFAPRPLTSDPGPLTSDPWPRWPGCLLGADDRGPSLELFRSANFKPIRVIPPAAVPDTLLADHREPEAPSQRPLSDSATPEVTPSKETERVPETKPETHSQHTPQNAKDNRTGSPHVGNSDSSPKLARSNILADSAHPISLAHDLADGLTSERPTNELQGKHAEHAVQAENEGQHVQDDLQPIDTGVKSQETHLKLNDQSEQSSASIKPSDMNGIAPSGPVLESREVALTSPSRISETAELTPQERTTHQASSATADPISALNDRVQRLPLAQCQLNAQPEVIPDADVSGRTPDQFDQHPKTPQRHDPEATVESDHYTSPYDTKHEDVSKEGKNDRVTLLTTPFGLATSGAMLQSTTAWPLLPSHHVSRKTRSLTIGSFATEGSDFSCRPSMSKADRGEKSDKAEGHHSGRHVYTYEPIASSTSSPASSVSTDASPRQRRSNLLPSSASPGPTSPRKRKSSLNVAQLPPSPRQDRPVNELTADHPPATEASRNPSRQGFKRPFREDVAEAKHGMPFALADSKTALMQPAAQNADNILNAGDEHQAHAGEHKLSNFKEESASMLDSKIPTHPSMTRQAAVRTSHDRESNNMPTSIPLPPSVSAPTKEIPRSTYRGSQHVTPEQFTRNDLASALPTAPLGIAPSRSHKPMYKSRSGRVSMPPPSTSPTFVPSHRPDAWHGRSASLSQASQSMPRSASELPIVTGKGVDTSMTFRPMSPPRPSPPSPPHSTPSRLIRPRSKIFRATHRSRYVSAQEAPPSDSVHEPVAPSAMKGDSSNLTHPTPRLTEHGPAAAVETSDERSPEGMHPTSQPHTSIPGSGPEKPRHQTLSKRASSLFHLRKRPSATTTGGARDVSSHSSNMGGAAVEPSFHPSASTAAHAVQTREIPQTVPLAFPQAVLKAVPGEKMESHYVSAPILNKAAGPQVRTGEIGQSSGADSAGTVQQHHHVTKSPSLASHSSHSQLPSHSVSLSHASFVSAADTHKSDDCAQSYHTVAEDDDPHTSSSHSSKFSPNTGTPPAPVPATGRAASSRAPTTHGKGSLPSDYSSRTPFDEPQSKTALLPEVEGVDTYTKGSPSAPSQASDVVTPSRQPDQRAGLPGHPDQPEPFREPMSKPPSKPGLGARLRSLSISKNKRSQ